MGSAKKVAALDRSVKALGRNALRGVDRRGSSRRRVGGADFQVFSSDETPAAALNGEGRTLIMQVQPELPDSLLRTLDQLPVDGFLVSLDGPLTVAQLMRLARVRGATSRRLLVHLGALPAKADAEQLRDAGAASAGRGRGGTDRRRFPRDARDAARTAAQVSPATRWRALRRNRAAAVVRRGPLGAPASA